MGVRFFFLFLPPPSNVVGSLLIVTFEGTRTRGKYGGILFFYISPPPSNVVGSLLILTFECARTREKYDIIAKPTKQGKAALL